MLICQRITWYCCLWMLLLAGLLPRSAKAAAEELAEEYSQVARPLLSQFCYQCHQGDEAEAELDLTRYGTAVEVAADWRSWQRILEVVSTGDMPPPEVDQPSDAQRDALRDWIRRLLTDQARAHAGDPGPIGLRRLDNAEYTYVLRDVTGIVSLDPTREFPIDGAAGKALPMWPAGGHVAVDGAKVPGCGQGGASHLMLLPDGVRFSQATTQRDQTDELLARIQAFTAATADGGGTAVDLQGIRFETNQGGLLPLRPICRLRSRPVRRPRSVS